MKVTLSIFEDFDRLQSSHPCWVRLDLDVHFRQLKPAAFSLVLANDGPNLPSRFDEVEIRFLDRDGVEFDALALQDCRARAKTQWAPDDPRRVTVSGIAYDRGLTGPELRRLFWLGSVMPEWSWVGLSPRRKRAWLALARHRTLARGVRSGVGSGLLDMRLVDSVEALYCGLGEAMRGPGGSVGVDLDDAEYLIEPDVHPTCRLANFEAWKTSQKTPDLPWRIEQMGEFIALEIEG